MPVAAVGVVRDHDVRPNLTNDGDHRADAAGYVFWADRVIEIDGINPQLASRLARAMDHWRRLAEPYRTAAQEAVSGADVAAIDALLEEQPDEPQLYRAALLAHALAGDFDTAFARLADAPLGAEKTGADLWALLAAIGPKSAVLSHAILAEGDMPQLDAATRETLARRLTDYGFGGPALRWLDAGADPQALAAAALAAGDPQAALAQLSVLQDADAITLRAQALSASGQPDQAAQLLADHGEGAAAAEIRLQAGDWADLGKDGPEIWQAASATLAPLPRAKGPLTTGRAYLDGSAQTRATLAALLDQVPRPEDAPAD